MLEVMYSDLYEPARRVKQLPLPDYGKQGELLGKGTYGKVYSFSKKYAVKKMKFEELGYGYVPGAVEREIAITLSLKHPNIIKIIDVTQEGNSICLVLPKAQQTLTD